MRRAGFLIGRIAEPGNLREAFLRAARGKAGSAEVVAYREALAENPGSLGAEILCGSVRVGGYRQFLIHDPKERVITVAPFAQRVLHHAVMGVCEPHFENRLVSWTCACRRGKGRLVALDLAGRHSRRFDWYLKLDIRKYFDSVPHERLLARLCRMFKDRALMALLERIVGSFETSPGRGLPIGNLTSQHFANLYLDGLDRFLEQEARRGSFAAVRYMDDTVVWSRSKADLQELRRKLREFLPGCLGLELKQERIGAVASGVPFLGCRVHRTHRELNRAGRVRFARKVAVLDRLLAEGRIDERTAQQRACALGACAATVRLLDFRRRALRPHFRVSAMGMAPTAASAAGVGTTTRTTPPWPTGTTTTTRTTATTTSASAWPAAQEELSGWKDAEPNRPIPRSAMSGQTQPPAASRQ
jgi:RNA-directed DNA polymerase